MRVLKLLFIYIFILVCFVIFSLIEVLAGVDLIEKKEGNFIVYYSKINKTLNKVFYIHKNYYSKDIIDVLDYFSKNVDNYQDIKYVYDDYRGVYTIFLKGKRLVSIDKRLSFLSGYSSKEGLLNSYLILLRNYVDLIPPVFFEKNYLLALVNKEYYIKIANRKGVSYNVFADDNLAVSLINNNLLKITPMKVGNYSLKIVANNNNSVFEDELIIDSKIPVFDVLFSNYFISYSTDFNYLKKVNWFDSLILPNIKFNYLNKVDNNNNDNNNNFIKLDYSYDFKNNKLVYRIFPKKQNFNKDFYYLNTEKVVLNFEKRDIYNPIGFDYLIITNNPEKIKDEGLLYENYLQADSDYFIWFHHLFLNNKYFIIQLDNENNFKVDINYYLDYEISFNEIQSGINASYYFFDFLNNNRFIRLSMSPKSSMFLFCNNLKKDNILSGFAYLKANNPLKIKIYAINNKYQFNKELPYLDNDNSLRSTGKFDKPFIQKDITFYLSNQFYSLRIPIKEEELKLANFNNANNVSSLNYSNYGVVYKIRLNIINNTAFKQKVFLYGSSVSGYTPFVFLYKGNIFRADSGMYKNLLTFYLEPNEEINENIYFLITPGLFYPIELELTTNKL
ncbi:MAG: hypothetical protein N2485_03760 [bacterium]|nr:hypothetical protein [bacterium]